LIISKDSSVLSSFWPISLFPNLKNPKEFNDPLSTSLPIIIFAAFVSEVTSSVASLVFLRWTSEFGISVPIPIEVVTSRVFTVAIPRSDLSLTI
jgi:hypothetical protein